MAGCILTEAYSLDCVDKKKAVGGVRAKVWIGNIEQLDQTIGDRGFTISVEGYITAINFTTYGRLYAWSGVKAGNSANDDAQRTAGSGVAFYPHNVLLKVIDITPEDRKAIETLANADGVFVIIERAGGVFEIFGRIEGLALVSAPSDRGADTTIDTGRVITLSGNEPEMAKLILVTDYATTRALIESYE